MTRYLWQQKDWMDIPEFSGKVENAVRENSALEQDLYAACGQKDYQRECVRILALEMESSFAIEGVFLDTYKLRSEAAKALGITIPEWKMPGDEREARAIAAALHSLHHAHEALSLNHITELHKTALSPDHGSPNYPVGAFRKEDVVIRNASGATAYHAPSGRYVPELMAAFVIWWKQASGILHPYVLGALAHLYFVVIHPFGDGNGRLGRMLAERAFTGGKSENKFRLYSLSAGIADKRSLYYEALAKVVEKGKEFYLLEFLGLHKHALVLAQTYFTQKNWFASVSPSLDEYERCMLSNIVFNRQKGESEESFLYHNALPDFMKRDILRSLRRKGLIRGLEPVV